MKRKLKEKNNQHLLNLFQLNHKLKVLKDVKEEVKEEQQPEEDENMYQNVLMPRIIVEED